MSYSFVSNVCYYNEEFLARRKSSTLRTTLAIVMPTAMATTQKRNSLANDNVEEDMSKECLMFKVVNATAWRTATSEDKSMGEVASFTGDLAGHEQG